MGEVCCRIAENKQLAALGLAGLEVVLGLERSCCCVSESFINQSIIMNRSCSELLPSPALQICECSAQLLKGLGLQLTQAMSPD